MSNLTKSQQTAEEVSALIRARSPLLWIVTLEEARVEPYLMQAALAAQYVPRTWDVSAGAADLEGKQVSETDPMRDPGTLLDYVKAAATSTEKAERNAWILRDMPVWLSGAGGATTLRQLRNLTRLCPTAPLNKAQTLIVLTTSAEIPPELSGVATVVDWPLPDRAEVAEILDATMLNVKEEKRAEALPDREAAIDSAVGLSGQEVQACYSGSLVQLKRIDPARVAQEKKRVITRERVLEYYEPTVGGLDAVGGLETLKGWLKSRSNAYTVEARNYGLPLPKGTFVGGISGCGKSLTAKAVAATWMVPLVRLDLGGLKSKFVGESEEKLRRALKTIDAIGRCVVWVDEVEKALQGATSGSADGGVSSDALGTLLTWMEERRGGAFVIATANDVDSLPPEFLRKGRFDQAWWVDLPTLPERASIVAAALRSNGRAETVDCMKVAEACNLFTGSEVAALVPDALYLAFEDGARPIETRDLLAAAATVVPLAKTAETKIAAMRKWAQGRLRFASAPVVEAAKGSGVLLDL